MSTNSNASQTLFRFVSLRNPQLTETKRRNLGFIHRPKGIAGIFDTAVSGRAASTAKINAMENAVKSGNFANTSFKTEKELETGIFSQLLIIGRKISKKEKVNDQDLAYTKSYYATLIDSNKELNGEGLKIFDLLWNNLIYQVVSQKDFYVKEAITHILKAIHLGFAQNMTIDADVLKANGEKPLENALNGKIVLPKELFVEDESVSGGSSVASRTASTVIVNKITSQRLTNEAESALVAQKALHRKGALQNLNSELEKLQKSYYTSKYKTEQVTYAEYQKKYQPQLEEYAKLSEEIVQLEETKAPEEELQKLHERLKELEVPAFEFSYKNEIDISELQSKLSPESFDLFIELFSDVDTENASRENIEGKAEIISGREMRIGERVLQIDSGLQSFNEAISNVQQEISVSTQTALENTSLPQQQYVNLGGASIPVIQNTARTPMAYSLIANTYGLSLMSSRGFLSFSFEVEDISWEVANAKIIADTNLGHIEENYGNISVVDNKITLPASLVNKFSSIYNFRVEITFANGREAYGDVQKIANGEIHTGMLTLKPVKADPREEESAEPSKRKNFGIKRLGIADYLKVVQSVHAYVPGEVSNIENVMASELRHKSSVARDYSEITDTTSKSVETEKVSDTSKTSRTDMQTEVAKELDKQQSIAAYAHFSYNPGYKLDIGADYANNTAQHDSTRQAVAKSQEITERAMERVLTKINEERVQKIIKEYTETNVHEFDNRGKSLTTNVPPQHITGVYRWIDKKMKNQIYNYGKRTMFEFMVPEPAKLHRLALAVSKGQVLTAPVDPRKAPEPWNMASPKAATRELLQHWADIYGVTLTELPKENVEVYQEIVGRPNSTGSFGAVGTPINITQNYAAKDMKIQYYMDRNSRWHNSEFYCSNGKGGERNLNFGGRINQDTVWENGLNLSGTFNFLYRGRNIEDVTLNVTLYCKLSDAFMLQWQTENYNAIIKAYEEAYKKFQEEQARLDAEQKEKEAAAKEKQGTFYRYMEHDVLKHNCIAYLLQDYLNVLGQNFTDGDKMENFQVFLNENLDKYTALAKFMEQAFEWEIMDYTFYPYYWANRKMWQEMYVSESVDPLFRSFLQAGMARVVVTVKPGFEDAVQFFMTTGKIWNGGEVPVIGDPMYMSIVDEMREPTGKPQGKYWITRVPTTLTILQDKSTGLPVNQPLPIFPETDTDNCENPSELETETSFDHRDVQLSHSDKTESTLD
ncbi:MULTISPECIES: hypothetical protein [unclassified Chryseobacterium]|uniref:hypothetical protein n=1 Tax=unclassified Chryseobacterium TaxID=2593645 RepID=UPI000D38E375|nr:MULTISPECIES: hypothetical protein [unclassified Chryseobacterium]PTT75085.1 hypothetical protein DBR25_09150 [Chryseobacterium sp. HMWF001]PVV60599.1 hypothetical protein DD829_04570 [Chryseobacterium sp. HMWF035]